MADKLANRPNRLELSQSVRREWTDYPAVGNSLESILADPAYWAHVARNLTIGDEITLFAQDQSFWARVLVVNVGNVFAKVALIEKVELGATEEIQPQTGYEVKWLGPKAKFGAVRLSDKQMLKSQFATRQEAADWLAQHMKALAA